MNAYVYIYGLWCLVGWLFLNLLLENFKHVLQKVILFYTCIIMIIMCIAFMTLYNVKSPSV